MADLDVSKSTCSLWLRDVVVDGVAAAAPPAEPAEGPQQEARELRLAGLPPRAIADRLGTSARTVYSWTWDLPVPAASRHGGDAAHMDMMRRRYWDRVQAERAEERARIQQANAARVGAITRRELELAAVVAYWCEGSTSKPWKRKETVAFINSDPGLILLWCAWLDDIGFPVEHRRLSLSVHTSADVPAATAHWADLIGVQVTAFGPPSLKRHNPKTVRKNVGDGDVGCPVVRLVRCREVYQRIEGVWQGIMGGLPAGSLDGQSRVV